MNQSLLKFGELVVVGLLVAVMVPLMVAVVDTLN
jgi:hypothetical protein